MPVASAIAAFFGFLLIGWRWIMNKVRAVYRFVFRIPAPPMEEADAVGGSQADAEAKS